jgi:hypothetical protein
MDRSPGTVTLMGSLGLSYAYTGRCDKAMPLFQRGLLYSSQGEGLSDNLSGTIEEGKQQVMVGIFYVGYSHCATNLQSMLDYVKKALEVQLTRAIDFHRLTHKQQGPSQLTETCIVSGACRVWSLWPRLSSRWKQQLTRATGGCRSTQRARLRWTTW